MDSRTLYIRKLILLSRIKKRYDRIVSLSLIKIEIYESIPLKKKNNFFFSRIENRVKILSVDKE